MPNRSKNVSEIDFMKEALLLAEQAAQEEEVPVGAIVVYQGQVIGRGYNRREQNHDPTGHAEIQALQEASQFLKSWRVLDATLYVTLEPCPMCLAACQQARVARVVYGATDPKGGSLSLGYRLHEDARRNHRFQVDYLAMPECEKVLKEFFKKRRE